MKLIKTKIPGPLVIKSKIHRDHRGFLRETFKNNLFKSIKFPFEILSYSKKNVLRGIHLQTAFSQDKILTVTKGKIFDVAVDLRKDSKTFGKWHGVELNSENSKALFIPEGCAHGFQVLLTNSELLYIHSNIWVKESENGIRFDDPNIAINWPLEPKGISNRDLSLPFFNK